MIERKKERDKFTWKLLALALVIALLAGVVGAALSAQIYIKPGPQGEQGPQGIPGINGTDAILQILQNRNDTQEDTSSYTAMQWFNMSEFDSSMKITINIQQNSKIFAEFSGTHFLESPASIWVRIVVDNNYNSSTYMCSLLSPASGQFRLPGHTEFLTNPLDAGQHTIDVQFLRESGSPDILDRTLTVTEIASQ